MAITLQDKSLENRLIELSKELKIKAEDLLKQFVQQQIDQINEKQKLTYKKEDPFKNIKKLDNDINQNEFTNPFENIEDVEEYANNLRKSAWK